MTSLIFEDLNIDHSTMMSDPEHFCEQVFKAAEELKTILRQDTSITSYVKQAEKISAENFDYSEVDQKLQEFYNYCESLPVGVLTEVAQRMRKLSKDVEYLARDKAIDEISQDGSHISKPLAHDLYKTLRKKFNDWHEAMTEILGVEILSPKLPAMPGNYGSPVNLNYFTYLFPGETESFKLHHAVLKRLNLPYMNLVDFHDYLAAHPELEIKITKMSH